MKKLAILFGILVLCWTGHVQANESKVTDIISKPIEIKGGTSALMSVVFDHKIHRQKGVVIPCQQCHHESSSDLLTSSCTAECHSTPGARERDPMSMFMAFHAPTDRSCYGCHSSLAEASPEKYPSFQGCRPCHSSPEAEAQVAKAH